MSKIPTWLREALTERDPVCVACGSGRSLHVHHRQRRRDGGHSLANTVRLCPSDHRLVHAEPTWARQRGFIVSAAVPVERIQRVPVVGFYGLALLTPDGYVIPLTGHKAVSAVDWSYDHEELIDEMLSRTTNPPENRSTP